jgi:hypothetical protein
MRQVHTAGEKAFIEYAVMRPTIVVDPPVLHASSRWLN